mgnify:CR=1 FL=1
MSRFCLIDVSNLIHRARHGFAKSAGNDEEMVGGILHVVFNSVAYVHSNFDIDHLVFCFDNGSWRKLYYKQYKKHREEKLKDNEEEKRIRVLMSDTIQELKHFLKTKTNVTVLSEELCEADDFIARWTQLHPNDDHLILSSDSDFVQLSSENIDIFNPVSKKLIHRGAIYIQASNLSRKNIIEMYNSKWKKETSISPEWKLFEKVCRGDAGDNITRSVPSGYRTKNLQLIFEDPSSNIAEELFSTLRKDEEGEPSVKELFERNQLLINLTKQPNEIKELLDASIISSVNNQTKSNIGFDFVRFCSKFKLNRIKYDAIRMAPMLQKGYEQ